MEHVDLSFDDFLANRKSLARTLMRYGCPNTAQIHHYSEFARRFEKNFDGVYHRLPNILKGSYLSSIAEFHDASRVLFPRYVCIMPELIVDDWLSAYDFRQFNRDHVIHQYMVYYTVEKLLALTSVRSCVKRILDNVVFNEDGPYTMYFKNGILLDPKLEERSKSYLQTYAFKKSAILAAMYHDIGYPYQYIGKYHSTLPVQGEPASTRNKYKEFFQDKRVWSAFQDMDDGDQLALLDESIKNTHSVHSAFTFLSLSGDDTTSKDLDGECVEWASLGILKHDLDKIYLNNKSRFYKSKLLRVSIEDDPLSALLILADSLQDFYRHFITLPSRDKAEVNSRSVLCEYDCSCSKVSLTLENEQMLLALTVGNKEKYYRKVKTIKSAWVDRLNPIDGFLDLSGLGVKEILIRVHCESPKLDYSIACS